MWRTGLVAPRHVGSSWTRARIHVPCVGRRILNHCVTREAPIGSFFYFPQLVPFSQGSLLFYDRYFASASFLVPFYNPKLVCVCVCVCTTGCMSVLTFFLPTFNLRLSFLCILVGFLDNFWNKLGYKKKRKTGLLENNGIVFIS